MSDSQLQLEVWDKIQNPIEAMHEMGMAFAKSGLLHLERVEAGEVLAWACMCERKSPIEIDKQYHIMNGRLSQKAEYSYAVFLDQGGTVKWIRHGAEPDQKPETRQAIAEFSFNGQTIEVSFSMEDARRANLVRKGSAWETFPHKMLQKRVLSDGISLLAPGISCGLEDYAEAPSQPAPAKEIKLVPKPAEAPAPKVAKPKKQKAKKEEPKVVDAEVVDDDDKPFPPPEEPKEVFEKLPEDVFEKLQQALGALGLRADKWMRKQGWLKEGMTMQHLPLGRAETILANLDAFTKRVKKEVPA
jgi:hypothetical protein